MSIVDFTGLQSIETVTCLEITKVNRKTTSEPFKGLKVGDTISLIKKPYELVYSRRGGGAVSVEVATKNGRFTRFMSDLKKVLNANEKYVRVDGKWVETPPTFEFKAILIENYFETEED